MLSTTLDESLPEGAVMAKYRLAVRTTQDASHLYTNFLQIRGDFAFLDVILRECSRLVSSHCSEQAAAIEGVRARAPTEGALVWMEYLCCKGFQKKVCRGFYKK
jgi:hypothetical protein